VSLVCPSTEGDEDSRQRINDVCCVIYSQMNFTKNIMTTAV
jgi:hypothetical protein